MRARNFTNHAHFLLTTPSLLYPDLYPDDGLSISYPTLPAYRIRSEKTLVQTE